MFQKAMYEIKCPDCGKTTMVSCEPKKGRPVYCNKCWSKYVVRQP